MMESVIFLLLMEDEGELRSKNILRNSIGVFMV